jgi:transcriptional regulator with XRE-family HTH domain
VTLATRLREEREKKGWNQRELAKVSDVSHATISRIETGKTLQVRSHVLMRLASALNVPTDYLVTQTQRITSNEIVRDDPDARWLLTMYMVLGGPERKELVRFATFLAQKLPLWKEWNLDELLNEINLEKEVREELEELENATRATAELLNRPDLLEQIGNNPELAEEWADATARLDAAATSAKRRRQVIQ